MIAPPPLPRYVDVVEEPPPAVSTDAPAPGTLIAQLGAYATRARAEEALLVVQISAAPEAVSARVREEPSRGRPRFRVVAGPLDPPGADRLCRRLHAARQPCSVVDTAAQPEGGDSP